MNIQTRYWPLPIPVRDFDWMAYDADTHEGEGSIVGWGRTEQEAIDELMLSLLESQEVAWEDMSEAERDRRDYEHGSPLHLMRYCAYLNAEREAARRRGEG